MGFSSKGHVLKEKRVIFIRYQTYFYLINLKQIKGKTDLDRVIWSLLEETGNVSEEDNSLLTGKKVD